MKVKHYLSKAQRKYLEEQINNWNMQVIHAEIDFRINKFESMRDLYISFVEWCGFKVNYNPYTESYIITK